MEKQPTLQELTHKRNNLKMQMSLLDRQIEDKRHEEWMERYHARNPEEALEGMVIKSFADPAHS